MTVDPTTPPPHLVALANALNDAKASERPVDEWRVEHDATGWRVVGVQFGLHGDPFTVVVLPAPTPPAS